jgi:hypothetical protein
LVERSPVASVMRRFAAFKIPRRADSGHSYFNSPKLATAEP